MTEASAVTTQDLATESVVIVGNGERRASVEVSLEVEEVEGAAGVGVARVDKSDASVEQVPAAGSGSGIRVEESSTESSNTRASESISTSEASTTTSESDIRRQSSPPAQQDQASSTEMNGDRLHPRTNSSSRRQRNGLFGINFDLNFDPSWLVPSNVAGRSMSMLPEWARPPVNIAIPNRDTAASSTMSESLQGHQHQHSYHHHHHGSLSSSGILGGGISAASRMVRHTTSSPSGTGIRSSNIPSSSHSNNSTPVIQHHHHAVQRSRHALTSMRSVDEDLDADYNPVSTIDLGAGRDRDSHSYVIDMDSPMGGWAVDEGVSTSHRGSVAGSGAAGSAGDNSHSNANNGGGSESDGDGASHEDGVGGTRRSNSDISISAGGDGGHLPPTADAATGANDRTGAAGFFRDAPETRAFINEISRYTTIRPFIVINFLKGVFDHGTSILAFLALVVTFSHANSMVKKEVSKQRKRNLLYLSMIVINLLACVAFVYYIFNEMELYYALVFLSTGSDLTSFWSLMWAVGVTDYVAKFGTVLVKILVVALPGCVVPFQKRGKYYLFIEHTSQVYRSFLPIYPWLFYLVSAYEGTARMFGLFLAGLYVFFKISDSVGRLKEWLKALEKLLSNVHYGTSPSAKQLDSAGTICPICHDNYSSPTRLSCTHIFCEECVATWFDRERTCPMCRAKVVDDPTYRDGSTSQYVQLF